MTEVQNIDANKNRENTSVMEVPVNGDAGARVGGMEERRISEFALYWNSMGPISPSTLVCRGLIKVQVPTPSKMGFP